MNTQASENTGKRVRSTGSRLGIPLVCIFVLALSSYCGSAEPDGLTAEEVTAEFLKGVANTDSGHARKYVTGKSKLFVSVGMKLFDVAASSGGEKEQATATELKEDLLKAASNIQCQGDEQIQECVIDGDERARLPVRMTDEGWRVDLWHLIERQKEASVPMPEEAVLP